MINYILAGLVGIVLYQLVCMIVYIATNENDNIMAIMGMFIPFCVWNYCIGPIVVKIQLVWCRRNLNGYRFCWHKKDGTIDGDLHTFYATNKVMKNFTQDENNHYFIKVVSTGKNFKSIPWRNDIYNGQPHFHGWDMSKFKNTED